MAEIKEKIEELVNSHLIDDSIYLVDVEVAGGRSARKVTVLLDSDQGVSIDACARLSRSLSEDLDQLDLLEGNYSLDVSSPGLDQPLKLQRQYKKNIGREVKVVMVTGAELKGKLVSVSDEGIKLEKKPSGKLMDTVEDFIGFDKIKYTKILISFK